MAPHSAWWLLVFVCVCVLLVNSTYRQSIVGNVSSPAYCGSIGAQTMCGDVCLFVFFFFPGLGWGRRMFDVLGRGSQQIRLAHNTQTNSSRWKGSSSKSSRQVALVQQTSCRHNARTYNIYIYSKTRITNTHARTTY